MLLCNARIKSSRSRIRENSRSTICHEIEDENGMQLDLILYDIEGKECTDHHPNGFVDGFEN